MKYILLTGGTGFIGSHLADKLLKENYNLILIKRSFSNTWRINHLLEKNYENLVVFNLDETKLENIFNNFNINGILHLATAYIKNPVHNEISTIVKSNIEFPSNLIDLAVDNQVKYFINTGTFFEYSKCKLPLSESSEIDSLNFYSTSKVAFEDILKYYYKEHNIHAATLKLFTPYGPKDEESKIIPYLILNNLNNQKISINNPENRLDIVHVFDIVDAYLKLMDNIMNFNTYEVFNVANQFTYSINQIHDVIKYNLNLQKKPEINEKQLQNFSDPTKIKNMLDWEPKINLYEGIKNTVEFYKTKYKLR